MTDPVACAITATGLPPLAWSLLPLTVLLIAASAIDCAHRRIPKVLLALGGLSAAVCQAALPPGVHPMSWHEPGTPGLLSGLMAALLMLALCVILWRLGLFGAGDAKWLTVTAAHAGPGLVTTQLLLTALAGGVLALWWKVRGRRDTLPYAVAIAGGQFALMGLMAQAGAPDSPNSTLMCP